MPPHSTRADARWEAAAEEHQVALAAYVDAAEGLPEAAWTEPWAAGKWTRAEVTEHLCLAYEALLTELRTGVGMKPRLSPWRQKVTRWILLPHILHHRTFPVRAVAPRETRPASAQADRFAALRRLRVLAERFEAELDGARRAGAVALTHPYFGAVEPIKGLRFCAVHLDHHRRQVASARGAGSAR